MTGRATDARRGWRPSLVLPGGLLLGLASLAGCAEKDVVFKERPPFEQPPAAAGGFLGYYGDPANKQPTCANCHATFGASWEKTGHADAWEALQASGHAAASCEPCHTVSENGNILTEPAGYQEVPELRYTDVQCESCHGPGLTHVSDPTASNAPLCSILADTATTVGCGACHTGVHEPYVDQWLESGHAKLASHAMQPGCMDCHEGRTALRKKFSEQSDYLEKNGTENIPITCAVCHDPHGSDFTAELRGPVDIEGTGLPSDDELCFRCHSREGTPPSSHGPHAAQGLLVFQEDIGWLPPGFQAPPISSHGSAISNPLICITCHVSRFTVSDPNTGGFVFQSVGHTFEAIPCLDAQGIPVPGPCTLDQRDFSACVTSGCHGNVDGVKLLFTDLQDAINTKLDSLWVDTNGNGSVDPTPTDAGLVPQVLAAFPTDTIIFDPNDDLVTVGEGVWWNAQIAHTDERPLFSGTTFYVGLAGPDGAGINWSAHSTSGDGVHNPEFLKALLSASIQALIAEYLAP